jgi:hypothetical protein
MRNLLALFTVTLALFSGSALRAAEATPPSAEELEAKFKAAMTDIAMSGRWTPVKDGAMGAEKEDKYAIVSVEKISGSSWVINARMRNVVMPIPVKVLWAGDTAVIIVDNLQIPGAGNYGGAAYSARVMIHDGTYAGTWSGGDHGGLLSGLLTKAPASSGTAK